MGEICGNAGLMKAHNFKCPGGWDGHDSGAWPSLLERGLGTEAEVGHPMQGGCLDVSG